MEGSKRSRCTGETWNRNPGRGEDESATDRNATKSSLADADVDNQVIEQIKLVGIVCYSSPLVVFPLCLTLLLFGLNPSYSLQNIRTFNWKSDLVHFAKYLTRFNVSFSSVPYKISANETNLFLFRIALVTFKLDRARFNRYLTRF